MSSTAFHFESFEAFSPFSDVGPYRAADYWQLPEGSPVELIKGRFVGSPRPNVLHQTIVGLLFEMLQAAARTTGSKAMFAPMDVTLSDDTILQPDLLYISKPRRHIVKQRVEGPPDLVIEIISGTSRRDRVAKLDLYGRYDVSEYWIVDPAGAAHRVPCQRRWQVRRAITGARPLSVAEAIRSRNRRR